MPFLALAFLLPGVIYFALVLITLVREEWVNAHSFALLQSVLKLNRDFGE